MRDPEPSEDVENLALQALEHAIGSIDHGSGPLVPFLMVRDGEGVRIARFVDEDLGRSVASGRDAARGIAANCVTALAFDGFLTMDGKRTDAMIVQCADIGAGPTFQFAVRYRVTPQGRVKVIGEPMLVEWSEELYPE